MLDRFPWLVTLNPQRNCVDEVDIELSNKGVPRWCSTLAAWRLCRVRGLGQSSLPRRLFLAGVVEHLIFSFSFASVDTPIVLRCYYLFASVSF